MANVRKMERLILDRDDLLELTRRMNVSRNCFSRLAGAYLDEEGYVDGTFNIHFGKLTPAEKDRNLSFAKKIPFADTNVKLKGYRFGNERKKQGSFWQLMMALRQCELKNDALMDSFYELVSETYQSAEPYAIYLYFGTYDVPVKNRSGENQWESEEVYQFLVCAICSLKGEYEVGEVESGFLFPAFSNRSTDTDGIAVFQGEGYHPELLELF